MSDNPRMAFGFDLGIASLGFAAVDLDGREVVHMASHLFSPPQESKTKASLAAKRRGYRSNRRNLERGKTRRNRCRRLLVDAGLVPTGADPKWFETRRGDADIVVLRHRALSERITDRELARVLIYFCKHRQYIDQGKGTGEGPEDGKVLKALAGNRSIMEGGDAETFGEVLYRRYEAGERTRNAAGHYELTIPHEMIRYEASLIIDRQIQFGNVRLSDDFKASYLSIVSSLRSTYERDLRTYRNVGFCTYFHDEVRAAKATLASEVEECLERLAHVRIVGECGVTALPGAVRRAATAAVFDPMGRKGRTALTYAMLRKLMNALGPDGPESMRETDHFRGADGEKGERAVLFSARGFAVVKSALSDDLELLEHLMDTPGLYDDIAEALTFSSSRESYERRLADLGVDERLDPAALSAVRGLPYGSAAFNGYGNRSRKALEILSECLREDDVDSLYQAEEACGLYGKRVEDRRGKGSLLPPYRVYDPTCTNPVVLRAAARFRAAFNEAVRAYGVPDVIRVELARDLKCSSAEKARIARAQDRNRGENDRARAAVAGILGIEQDEVSGRQIVVFRFYEDQSGRDIYVDEPMDLERALKDPKYVEIDHILPLSRSCDDSKSNKILCLSKSNQEKAGRTPFEWIAGADESDPRWIAFRNRVEGVRKSIGGGKARRLTMVDFESAAKGFIDRNLNDTRYLSRSIMNWVESSIAFPEGGRRHVFSVAGGATSILRRRWGLNFGAAGEKDRGDDRHHAVDAAVIAMVSPGLVRKCAEYGERRECLSKDERDRLMGDTLPWPTFADEVRAARDFVIPTLSSPHNLRGPATDDTLYGYRGERVKRKGAVALVCKGGKVRPSSTALKCGDGFKMQGAMAFVRLWLDPAGGRWLVEPVYCSDLPRLADGSYIPRYCSPEHGHRSNWPEVPRGALEGRPPIMLHKGDALLVNGRPLRFKGLDVSGRSMEWEEVLCPGRPSDENDPFPTFGRWDSTRSIRTVSEDPLGFCWQSHLRSRG